jgi:hypothetical protein
LEFTGRKDLQKIHYYDKLKKDYCNLKSIPLLEISYKDKLNMESLINNFWRDLYED